MIHRPHRLRNQKRFLFVDINQRYEREVPVTSPTRDDWLEIYKINKNTKVFRRGIMVVIWFSDINYILAPKKHVLNCTRIITKELVL